MAKKIIYVCDKCKKEINNATEYRYVYGNRTYHYDCLLSKLKLSKKPKFSPGEIKKILSDSKQNKKTSSSKVVKVKATSKQEFDEIQKDIDKLYNYIDLKYYINIQNNKRVKTLLDQINRGVYHKLPNHPVSYTQLYDMFQYYNNEIETARAHMKNQSNVSTYFFYDLAVLLNKVTEYENILRQNEQQRVTTETQNNISVTTYLKGRVKNEKTDRMDDINFWNDFD